MELTLNDLILKSASIDEVMSNFKDWSEKEQALLRAVLETKAIELGFKALKEEIKAGKEVL